MLTGNNDNESGLQAFVAALQGKPLTDLEKKNTNLGYTCGAKISAERRVAKSLPIWRYRWMAQFPNQRLTETAGAW